MNKNHRVPSNRTLSAVEVKSKFGAEFRRFSLDRSKPGRFDEFYGLLQHVHRIPNVDLLVGYADIHGDLLPINNDDNYHKAISTAAPLLRLFLQRKGDEPQPWGFWVSLTRTEEEGVLALGIDQCSRDTLTTALAPSLLPQSFDPECGFLAGESPCSTALGGRLLGIRQRHPDAQKDACVAGRSAPAARRQPEEAAHHHQPAEGLPARLVHHRRGHPARDAPARTSLQARAGEAAGLLHPRRLQRARHTAGPGEGAGHLHLAPGARRPGREHRPAGRQRRGAGGERHRGGLQVAGPGDGHDDRKQPQPHRHGEAGQPAQQRGAPRQQQRRCRSRGSVG
ncbi:partitioning defective 6 homolog beta isoform X2 [Electrophorus electricus]|uniref:partitioning defective 6 homolog beta isoform X2 n=1 Tax=Electrophorus electricus TaxID=8005 RepID=UPI0015D0B6ED|nr:partitioning defective 6 homolog beta isoform X2 [Electrophorus electricus]